MRPVRAILPRRAALLKSALVAALIATAAGILWLPDPDGSTTGVGSSRSPAPPRDTTASGDARLPAGVTPPVPGEGSPAEPLNRPGQRPSQPDEPPPGAGQPVPARPEQTPALPPGTVGVPVRMAEPAVLAVTRPGARVDLLLIPALGDGAPPAPTVVATAALVLDVLDPDAVDRAGALYLALPPAQAQRVVAAPPDARFAVVIRP